jgi:lipopolysaccharide/colanic/teichoic acid biosynthesis glycosyltransferase
MADRAGAAGSHPSPAVDVESGLSRTSIDRTGRNGAHAVPPRTDRRARRDGPRPRRSSLLGYVHLDGGRTEIERFRWFCSSAELEHLVRLAPVRTVYISGNGRAHPEAAQAAVDVCQRLGIPFARPAHLGGDRIPLVENALADGYLDFVSGETTAGARRLKRLVDLVLSAAAIVALLPLFVVLAAIIKLTDGGPVFFGQQRVGLRGRVFTMFKFRSMVVNADALKPKLLSQNESIGPVFKMRRDPRITGVGGFLRKYSLDELPQLLNVLRGDMSLVGPRPPVPNEVAQYEHWQFRRFAVRPGLTCLWQVCPDRYRMPFEDWVRLDLQYIDRCGLRLDFSLMLRTVWVVLAGTGE